MFIPLMNSHLMKVKRVCNWCPEDRWVNAFQKWGPEVVYLFFLAFKIVFKKKIPKTKTTQNIVSSKKAKKQENLKLKRKVIMVFLVALKFHSGNTFLSCHDVGNVNSSTVPLC